MKTEQKPQARRLKFKVGDRVQFLLTRREVEGVIVEDRGPIGFGGRQLWGIEFQNSAEETVYTEMPEESLTHC